MALVLSVVNVYSLFLIQKHLKSNLIARSFDLLKKEVSLLNQQQTIHRTQTQFDASRLETLEKVLAAMPASHAGFGGDDDGSNGTIH